MKFNLFESLRYGLRETGRSVFPGAKIFIGGICLLVIILFQGYLVTYGESLKIETDYEDIAITDDLDLAKQQVEKYPDNPEAWFNLAVAYSRTMYVHEALQTIRKTKQVLREHENWDFLDESIERYESLVESGNQNPKVTYRLAFAYYFKGYHLEKHGRADETGPLFDKAIFYMKKTVEFDPNDIWAWNYLGFMTAEREHDINSAIKIWEHSLEISKENPGAIFMLGQAYFREGNIRKALKYMNEALVILEKVKNGAI